MKRAFVVFYEHFFMESEKNGPEKNDLFSNRDKSGLFFLRDFANTLIALTLCCLRAETLDDHRHKRLLPQHSSPSS